MVHVRAALTLSIGVVSLAGCTPSHTKSQGFLTYKPEDGYTWVDSKSVFFTVKWTPGNPSQNFANVYADTAEGYFVPSPGFTWIATGTNDSQAYATEVKWTPGQNYPSVNHITAADQEFSWAPESGYTWVNENDIKSGVKWTPGIADHSRSHIVASDTEGQFQPEDGYAFSNVDPVSNQAKTWDVACAPNQPSRLHPHVYAATQEGYWLPQSGYHFLAQNSLEVAVNDTNSPTSVSAGSGNQVDDNPWSHVVGTVVANGCAQDEDDDGFFFKHFVRPTCRAIRDDQANKAAKAFGF